MTNYVVTTPTAGYTGPVGDVHFQDGVAEVNDLTHAAELAYMRAAGYDVRRVGDAEPDPAIGSDSTETDEPEEPGSTKPKKTAPVGDWRAYAKTKGIPAEDADGMTKNQLVERFADEEETP